MDTAEIGIRKFNGSVKNNSFSSGKIRFFLPSLGLVLEKMDMELNRKKCTYNVTALYVKIIETFDSGSLI